jgi:hypothetical protein
VVGYAQGFMAQFIRSYLAVILIYGLFGVPLLVLTYQFYAFKATRQVPSYLHGLTIVVTYIVPVIVAVSIVVPWIVPLQLLPAFTAMGYDVVCRCATSNKWECKFDIVDQQHSARIVQLLDDDIVFHRFHDLSIGHQANAWMPMFIALGAVSLQGIFHAPLFVVLHVVSGIATGSNAKPHKYVQYCEARHCNPNGTDEIRFNKSYSSAMAPWMRWQYVAAAVAALLTLLSPFAAVIGVAVTLISSQIRGDSKSRKEQELPQSLSKVCCNEPGQ